MKVRRRLKMDKAAYSLDSTNTNKYCYYSRKMMMKIICAFFFFRSLELRDREARCAQSFFLIGTPPRARPFGTADGYRPRRNAFSPCSPSGAHDAAIPLFRLLLPHYGRPQHQRSARHAVTGIAKMQMPALEGRRYYAEPHITSFPRHRLYHRIPPRQAGRF